MLVKKPGLNPGPNCRSIHEPPRPSILLHPDPHLLLVKAAAYGVDLGVGVIGRSGPGNPHHQLAHVHRQSLAPEQVCQQTRNQLALL